MQCLLYVNKYEIPNCSLLIYCNCFVQVKGSVHTTVTSFNCVTSALTTRDVTNASRLDVNFKFAFNNNFHSSYSHITYICKSLDKGKKLSTVANCASIASRSVPDGGRNE
ncbi:hypothetical protein T11_1412 [Trichinella zimbabwensis]|uniref:Uncharacterized protein n=1 Tax=Trichinella zimbabwensis TaxID=268475 RepID=A0A0V1HHU5_9BILA|nr:hypothetical protein T11_1412 [Trichinella zimbabwensis]